MEVAWKIYITVFYVLSVARTHPDIDHNDEACFRSEPCHPDTLLSNTRDCQKYWQCLERGVWIQRECEFEGRFDSDLRLCVPAGNETCHPGCPPMTCPLPLPCNAGNIIPDPVYCQRFYQCIFRKRIWQERICPHDTMFNYLDFRCSPGAKCAKNCLTMIPGTRQLNVTEPTSVIVDPCRRPMPCEPGSLTADPSSCNKYLQCLDDGSWAGRICLGDQEFDYKSGECHPAGSASCHPACPGDLNCDRPEPCQLNALVPDPFNCQSFYQCDASLTWARLSCSPDLYFDMRLQVCVEENMVECHPECVIDPCETLSEHCPKTAIRVPRPEHCGTYHECPARDGYWLIKHCEAGKSFDYITKECEDSGICHPGCSHLNSTTTTEGPVEGEITNHTLTQVTGEALEGQSVEFICHVVTTPGVISGQLSWLLHGLRVSEAGRRFTINTTSRLTTLHQSHWTSTLVIHPLHKSDIGALSCLFEVRGGVSSTLSLFLSVVLRPSVSVSALTQTVARGGATNIRYFIDNAARGDTSVSWFKNGGVLIENADEVIRRVSDVEYVLEASNVDQTVIYGCVASSKAGESNNATCEVTIYDQGVPTCPADFEKDILWQLSVRGQISKEACPGNATGIASRMCCETNVGAEWAEANMNKCVDQEYQEVMSQISSLEDGLGIENPDAAVSVARNLESMTNNSGGSIKPGNLNVTTSSLFRLAKIHQLIGAAEASETEIISIVHTASNALGEANSDSWTSLLKEDRFTAVGVMSALDDYSSYLAKILTRENTASRRLETLHEKNIGSENIVLSSSEWISGNLTYPVSDMDWVRDYPHDKALIPGETLTSIAADLGLRILVVSNTYYRTLHGLLPVERVNQTLPTRVMSLSIEGLAEGVRFDKPIYLQFSHTQELNGKDTRSCHFWNYSSPTSGMWSGEGFIDSSTADDLTICEINHLTNFAVLVSQYRPDGNHHQVLSLLTIVGLSLSIISMIVTIVVYALLWKTIKSDYALMLLNVCGALTVANIVFLIGIEQVENQAFCAAIAAVLHFLFLAAFFLMLSEAIELLLYVVYVFHVHTPKETAIFLASAWGAPLVIVGISLGITKTNGYGNHQFCWLTVDRGVIWAFLGPMIAIILCNFVILGIVLRTLIASSVLRRENQSDRIRSAAWNVLILSPTLGLSWTFGLFSINENTLVFQYIFTFLNAFQGLFIFIFHCLCNKRVRDAFKDKYIKETSFSFTSSSGGFRGRLRKGSLASKCASSDTQLIAANSLELTPSKSQRKASTQFSTPLNEKSDQILPDKLNNPNPTVALRKPQIFATPSTDATTWTSSRGTLTINAKPPDRDEDRSYDNLTFKQDDLSVKL